MWASGDKKCLKWEWNLKFKCKSYRFLFFFSIHLTAISCLILRCYTHHRCKYRLWRQSKTEIFFPLPLELLKCELIRNFWVKSSANCHLNGLSRCQRYCHSMWRHGNFRFATMALKGGVVRAPMGCSINVFSAAVNGCEREHLNRFDRSRLRRKWSSANLFLTKTGKLPSRSPLWWDGSLPPFVCDLLNFFFFSAETEPIGASAMLI